MQTNLPSNLPSDFLNRPCALSWGLSADSTQWKQRTSVESLGEALAQITTLEHGEKDGRSFLQGRLKPGKWRRQATDMDVMEVMGFDVESGEDPEPIAEKAASLDLHVEIYPTFNDGKPETSVKTDADHKMHRLGPEADATEEQVIAYCVKYKGWLPHVAASAKLVGCKARKYIVSHVPTRRFRAVVPFSRPLRLDDFKSDAAAKLRWAMMLEEVGGMLGVKDYDEKCTDLSRLFYPHRRPHGADDRAIRVLGKGIDPYELKSYSVALEEHATRNGGDFKTRHKHTYKTPWLKPLLEKHSTKFRAADFVAFHADECVQGKDGVHTHCLDEHGSGTGTVQDMIVVNAEDATNEGGVFILKCNFHQTCADVSSWQHLDTLIAARGVSREQFLGFVDRSEEMAQATEIAAAIATITKASTSEQVESVLRLVAAGSPGLQDEIDLTEIVRRGPIGKRPLTTMLRRLRAEAAPAAADADGGEVTFVARMTALRQQIEADNAPDPTLFLSPDGAHMRITRNGRTRLEELDSEAWSYELNTRNAEGDCIGPSAAHHLKGDPNWNLPPLEGFSRVPVFGKHGTLRMVSGYDPATRSWLAPDFEIIPLPDVLTRDYVDDAVAWLREAVIDVPFSDRFGDADPLPIYLNGVTDVDGHPVPNPARGVSSFAHLLAMIAQPFLRHMIDGPFPAYYVDKTTNGDGGSLLTHVPGIIYDGTSIPPTPFAKDGDEAQKRLLASQRLMPAYTLLDNVNGRMDNGDLASMQTSGKISGRVLGSSNEITVPIVGSIIYTGVGVEFSAELNRRIVPIKLDAGMEDPENRTGFKYDFDSFLFEHRKQLVHAMHVLVAWWVQQGKPMWKGPLLGSYEAWSHVLGGVLDVTGVPGFLGSLAAFRASGGGAERSGEREIVERLAATYGERDFGTDDVGVLTAGLHASVFAPMGVVKFGPEHVAANGKKIATYIRQKLAGRTWQLRSKDAKAKLEVTEPVSVTMRTVRESSPKRWAIVRK